MDTIVEKQKCTGCTACMNTCPKKAIAMEADEKGFKYYKIDKEKCVDCGLCQKVCPVLNNKLDIEKDIQVYSCYNKNDDERKNSSSGGTFILLAKEIIKRGGVVFGASFDSSFKLAHTYAETENDLKKFMGSKYVQSDIGDNYKNAKEFLDAGRYVLFTGTPCQIEGLKSYLRKDYDKLYTQDIICHGVPSPKVWEKYLAYRKSKDGYEPKSISFRNKDDGWNNYNVKFEYEEAEYKKSHNEDKYIEAFLKNTYLRDSCYDCSFKKKYRESDITLADFWGIQRVDETMFDNKGTSLVLINSNKGKELFDSIREQVVCKDSSLDIVSKYNPSFVNSSELDKNREEFFNHLDDLPFDELVKKYTYHLPLKRRLKKILKKLLKKILNLKRSNIHR